MKFIYGSQKEFPKKVLHLHLQQKSFYQEVICYFGPEYELKFKGICLKQDSVSFLHKCIYVYITYELDAWSKDLNIDFTLGNCLFGAVKVIRMLIQVNTNIAAMA